MDMLMCGRRKRLHQVARGSTRPMVLPVDMVKDQRLRDRITDKFGSRNKRRHAHAPPIVMTRATIAPKKNELSRNG